MPCSPGEPYHHGKILKPTLLGQAGWASGLAGWASGLAGWPRGGGRTDERTDEQTYGKSPHSTGLRPLSGPLPKKGTTITQNVL